MPGVSLGGGGDAHRGLTEDTEPTGATGVEGDAGRAVKLLVSALKSAATREDDADAVGALGRSRA